MSVTEVVRKVVSARIEPELLAELEKIAKREDRPVSYILRRAVKEYLKSAKQ